VSSEAECDRQPEQLEARLLLRAPRVSDAAAAAAAALLRQKANAACASSRSISPDPVIHPPEFGEYRSHKNHHQQSAVRIRRLSSSIATHRLAPARYASDSHLRLSQYTAHTQRTAREEHARERVVTQPQEKSKPLVCFLLSSLPLVESRQPFKALMCHNGKAFVFHFFTVKLGGPNVTTGRLLFFIFSL
jgi:hypothetical protein